jgi:hypothetical protein
MADNQMQVDAEGKWDLFARTFLSYCTSVLKYPFILANSMTSRVTITNKNIVQQFYNLTEFSVIMLFQLPQSLISAKILGLFFLLSA